jgi:predicted RecA/RadA family phage recombinase
MATNVSYGKGEHIALIADQKYVSGAPVRIGAIAGVAMTTAEQGQKVTIWRNGSYRLPVKETVQAGAIVKLGADGVLTTGAGKIWGVALQTSASAGATIEVAPVGVAFD